MNKLSPRQHDIYISVIAVIALLLVLVSCFISVNPYYNECLSQDLAPTCFKYRFSIYAAQEPYIR